MCCILAFYWCSIIVKLSHWRLNKHDVLLAVLFPRRKSDSQRSCAVSVYIE
jgi:hypothetical protein